jgi:hypothetical protein
MSGVGQGPIRGLRRLRDARSRALAGFGDLFRVEQFASVSSSR